MSRLLYIIRDKKAIDLSLFLKGFQEKTSLYIIAKQRMILFPCAAKSARAALSAQVIHEICDHHRHDDKLPDPGIFRKCLGLISHIADNGVDLASVAGIHRGQLADHPFCRQAAPGEYIGGITIRHLQAKAQRDFCNPARLQGTVKRHINIRPGVIGVRTEGTVVLRQPKINDFDFHRPPPSSAAG